MISILAPLAGHNRREVPVFEPAEEALELGPYHGVVLEGREEDLDGVDRDPFRPDGVDGEAEPEEEPLEVEVAGLVNLAMVEMEVVDHELLLRDQPLEVETDRPEVLDEVRFRLFEREKYAGLTELGRPARQELHGQHRLARAGAAGNERGAAAWKAPPVISSRP